MRKSTKPATPFNNVLNNKKSSIARRLVGPLSIQILLLGCSTSSTPKPAAVAPHLIQIDGLDPWKTATDDCTDPDTAAQLAFRLTQCAGLSETCNIALSEQHALWKVALDESLEAQLLWLEVDAVDAAIAADGRWSPWLVGIVTAGATVGGIAVGIIFGMLLEGSSRESVFVVP